MVPTTQLHPTVTCSSYWLQSGLDYARSKQPPKWLNSALWCLLTPIDAATGLKRLLTMSLLFFFLPGQCVCVTIHIFYTVVIFWILYICLMQLKQPETKTKTVKHNVQKTLVDFCKSSSSELYAFLVWLLKRVKSSGSKTSLTNHRAVKLANNTTAGLDWEQTVLGIKITFICASYYATMGRFPHSIKKSEFS